PVLPVRKPGKQSWRFVQDLWAINAAVLPTFPVVPNPATILSCIPPSATYFTVIDLCSAIFSIPIHPDSQYLFAFTFQGLQYTWTRLPQGYTESPTHFSQILRWDLADLTFPMGSTLVQYVDDL
ncbi:Pr gag-pro-pol, partial [Chelydra serpentina]